MAHGSSSTGTIVGSAEWPGVTPFSPLPAGAPLCNRERCYASFGATPAAGKLACATHCVCTNVTTVSDAAFTRRRAYRLPSSGGARCVLFTLFGPINLRGNALVADGRRNGSPPSLLLCPGGPLDVTPSSSRPPGRRFSLFFRRGLAFIVRACASSPSRG